MAKQAAKATGADKTNELLRTLIVVQLGLAGVKQKAIREIVGGDINWVSRILKQLKGHHRHEA